MVAISKMMHYCSYVDCFPDDSIRSHSKHLSEMKGLANVFFDRNLLPWFQFEIWISLLLIYQIFPVLASIAHGFIISQCTWIYLILLVFYWFRLCFLLLNVHILNLLGMFLFILFKTSSFNAWAFDFIFNLFTVTWYVRIYFIRIQLLHLILL